MSSQYIKLHRSILSHPVWLQEPFTTAQAYIDLIFLAAPAELSTVYEGELVSLGIGQLTVQVEDLVKRWKWSPEDVSEYLDSIGAEECRPDLYRVTLSSYKKYQSNSDIKEKEEIPEVAKKILEHYNKVFKKRGKGYSWVSNMSRWMQTYTEEEIILAIDTAVSDTFWKDKLTLEILFRTRAPGNMENVDRIGAFLSKADNSKVKENSARQRYLDSLHNQ